MALDPPATNSYGLETNSIVTPQRPRTSSVPFGAAANTNLATPTNVTKLLTAGSKGARLTRLEVIATATQAATQVQFYRSADAGVTKRLIRAKAFPLYTLSTINDIPPLDLGFSDLNPLILGPNEEIYQGSAVAVTGLNGSAEWADW